MGERDWDVAHDIGYTKEWIRFQVWGIGVGVVFWFVWTLADAMFTSRRTRELRRTKYVPDELMLLVCQRFDVVFP